MERALTQRQALWLVAVLTLLGAYLRLFNLGDLGFRWDEDLSGLTVQAILEHGIPELPSGMLYLRGLGLSYLMAASAALLGFSELALRLPSALFGIATIPLCYLFGRRLFSPVVGVVAAGIFTVSFWDVEMGRYARMYAPFGFCYLLTLHLIWLYRVERQSLWGGCLAIAVALVAVFLHRLGFTLAFAFLIPELMRWREGWPRPGQLLFPGVAFAAVASFFWVWKELINDHFARFAMPMWQEIDQTASLVRSASGEVSLEPVGPLGSEIALPDFGLLLTLWATAPLAWLIGAVIIGLVGYATLRRYREQHDWAQRLLLLVIVVSCALPLLNVAILALATLVVLRGRGLAMLRTGDGRLAALLIPGAFLVWFALSLALDLGGHAADGSLVAVRRTIKDLLDYPRFYIFWGFVKEWPVMSVAALLGVLWALDRAAQRQPDRAALFLLLVFALPLTLIGLLRIPYELFRYLVPLNPLFYTLVALGVLHWTEPVGKLLGQQIPRRFAALATAGLVIIVLLSDLNPVRTWLATTRGYERTWLTQRLSVPPFPDYKTPSAYVKAHAAPKDLIFVLDSREIYNYLGRADFWVYSDYYQVQTYQTDDQVIRDKYVSTPLIRDLPTLKDELATPDRRKWLVASDRMLAETPAISPEIKAFIGSLSGQVAYTGLDGATKVYLFD